MMNRWLSRLVIGSVEFRGSALSEAVRGLPVSGEKRPKRSAQKVSFLAGW
jgi:hypothetical protein